MDLADVRAARFAGMLAYGAGLELAQWAVGWRFAEWADLAADAVGVALAWVLCKKAQGGSAK